MGYKVKEFREKIGMSQSELARRAGVSRQTIWSIEDDNQYRTTVTTLFKIATALGVKVDDIFFVDDVQSNCTEAV